MAFLVLIDILDRGNILLPFYPPRVRLSSPLTLPVSIFVLSSSSLYSDNMHLSIAFLVLGLVFTVHAAPVNNEAPKQGTPSKILDWIISRQYFKSPPLPQLPSPETASSTGPIHYQFFPIESIMLFPDLLPKFNRPKAQSEAKIKAQSWIREILSVYDRDVVEQPETAFAGKLQHFLIQIDSQVQIREHVTCPCQVIVKTPSTPGSKGMAIFIAYIDGEKYRVHARPVVAKDPSV
ncbi:hypothetical protein EV368DRAFT_87779 [Lentinula lateritia]|nr:hypothetical protein EV368DRAFT_87779 [Lentinula lateritia]